MIWRGMPLSETSVVRSTSWRRITSLSALERTNVKRPLQPDGGRDVIGCASRFQLIEKPQPLLRERGGQRTVAWDTDKRRGLGPPLRKALFDGAGQPRDGRLAQKVVERHLDVERASHASQELNGHERVAAVLEEAVVGADRPAAQQLGPELGQRRLDRPPWRDEPGAAPSRA